MRYAWMIVAIFAGRFVAMATFAAPGDGDLYWQRWLGRAILRSHALPRALGAETFTSSGAAWVPQEWLFSILAYASRGPGWPIFSAACGLCATAALALCAYRGHRRGAHPAALAAVTACVGIALVDSFGVRVQDVAWPLFALFLLALDIDGPLAYGAIAIVAVWANVHASVLLAPVLAAITTAGSQLDRGWSRATRRLAAITAGSALATCASPLGTRLPLYAISLFRSPIKAFITEWQHTSVSDVSFAFGALPLILCIVVFGMHGTTKWRDRFLFVTLAWLMFSAARNIAIFALAIAPYAAVALTNGIGWFRERIATVQPPAFARIADPLVSLALALGIGIGSAHMAIAANAARTDWPRGALGAIASLPGESHVFCADFAWCGPLLDSSRARVFMDGRADPYPVAVWNDFVAIDRGRPGWRQILAKRGVDVVLVGRTSPLEGLLTLNTGWHSIYRDAHFRVWQRSRPADNTRLAIR